MTAQYPEMTARFPETAATADEALRYYRNRAIQGLWRGWTWDGTRIDHGWGVEVTMHDPYGMGEDTGGCRSVFVLEGHTGQGHLTQWFKDHPNCTFVTTDMCEAMRDWLKAHHIQHVSIERYENRAYKAVESFYSNHTAERSGLHLMNHIDEGLDILTQEAPMEVIEAWCLHPLLQSDEHLLDTLAAGGHLSGQTPAAVVLAMEYRQWANAHLSKHEPKWPTWGPCDEVKQLLIADKMQNRKDFDLHLRGRVDNSDRLVAYFREWFDALGILEEQYTAWVESVAARTGQTP